MLDRGQVRFRGFPIHLCSTPKNQSEPIGKPSHAVRVNYSSRATRIGSVAALEQVSDPCTDDRQGKIKGNSHEHVIAERPPEVKHPYDGRNLYRNKPEEYRRKAAGHAAMHDVAVAYTIVW